MKWVIVVVALVGAVISPLLLNYPADQAVAGVALVLTAVIAVTLLRRRGPRTERSPTAKRTGRASAPEGEGESAPSLTEVLIASCNVTLTHLGDQARGRYRQLLEATVGVHEDTLVQHLSPADRPGFALAVDIDGSDVHDTTSVLLVVREKAILSWISGRGVPRPTSVMVPIADHEQLEIVERLPRKGRFQPDRIRLRLRAEGHDYFLDVFDIAGMETVVSFAAGVAAGSVTLESDQP
ncbi:MAG: hypothetical protein CMH83_18550 [Nocardioides sp.]|nr:hypothetical protein [Nocardioides sp.]